MKNIHHNYLLFENILYNKKKCGTRSQNWYDTQYWWRLKFLRYLMSWLSVRERRAATKTKRRVTNPTCLKRTGNKPRLELLTVLTAGTSSLIHSCWSLLHVCMAGWLNYVLCRYFFRTFYLLISHDSFLRVYDIHI